MTAKEYLQQLHRADVIIEQKMQEREELRARLSSIGSFDYSKDRVQTSPPGNAAYESSILRIVELENDINRRVDAYLYLKHKIIGEIHELENPDHIMILYKRYVEDKSLGCICTETYRSYNYIRHLHGCALKEFEDKILNLTQNNTQ